MIELLADADRAGAMARAARENVLAHWPIAKTVDLHDLTIGNDVTFELAQKDDGFYEIIAITPKADTHGGEQ